MSCLDQIKEITMAEEKEASVGARMAKGRKEWPRNHKVHPFLNDLPKPKAKDNA